MKLNKKKCILKKKKRTRERDREKESGMSPACSAAANSEGFGTAAGGLYGRQFEKVENITIKRTA